MKNRIQFNRFLILACCSIFMLVSACKKKEIKGPQGDPGTPGGGGNSSIVNSDVFSITSSQWKQDSATISLKASVSFSLLTKDVVDKGGVKVYRQTGSAWSELPYDQGDLLLQYSFNVGVLNLYYINIEGGFPSAPPVANYRMVILTESAKAARHEKDQHVNETFDMTIIQ